jgi:hypothetical protein
MNGYTGCVLLKAGVSSHTQNNAIQTKQVWFNLIIWNASWKVYRSISKTVHLTKIIFSGLLCVREIRGSVLGWDRISLFRFTVYLPQGLETNSTISWTSSIPNSKLEHFVPCFRVLTNWRGKSVTFRYLYQLQRFSNYLGRQTAEENSIISVFKTYRTLSSRNNARMIEKMRTMMVRQVWRNSMEIEKLTTSEGMRL